jgi:hypothetical protein
MSYMMKPPDLVKSERGDGGREHKESKLAEQCGEQCSKIQLYSLAQGQDCLPFQRVGLPFHVLAFALQA